jgi:hypothetical protein
MPEQVCIALVPSSFKILAVEAESASQVPVAHACKPGYSVSRDPEANSS